MTRGLVRAQALPEFADRMLAQQHLDDVLDSIRTATARGWIAVVAPGYPSPIRTAKDAEATEAFRSVCRDARGSSAPPVRSRARARFSG